MILHRPTETELRNPTTCDPLYSDAEREFMVAMERYKRKNRRPYPTCREVLRVIESLGYRKTEEPADPPTFLRGQGFYRAT